MIPIVIPTQEIVPDAVPHKGGHNDLSRWKKFGGTLERPAPPAPITKKPTA